MYIKGTSRVHQGNNKTVICNIYFTKQIEGTQEQQITNIHVRIYREILRKSFIRGNRIKDQNTALEEKKRPIYEHKYRSHYLSLQKVNINSHATHRSCLLKYRYFGE